MTLVDEIRGAVRRRGGHVEATTRDILDILQSRTATCPPGQRLTRRELDVLQLIATGHTNVRAAEALGVTEGAVVQRLKVIYLKLGVHDRAHALYRAIATGQLAITKQDA